MKKQNLIDTVSDFLASNVPDDMISQYHPEIIKKRVEIAFNRIIYEVWLNCKEFSDYSQLDAWSRRYSVPLYDPVITGQYVYAIARLPYPPVQLPDNMGIREVSIMADGGHLIPFAYIDLAADAIFNELEVSSLDDSPTFRVEQNNNPAIYKSHVLRLAKIPVELMNNEIEVIMVVPLDQIDDYEDIAIPAGMEDYLVDRIIEIMSGKPNPDLSPDQIPNRPHQ